MSIAILNDNQNNNSNSKSIKVKIFYTIRGSKSTRLTTFSISNHHDENDLSLVPIPLKTCLWSICTSSPDMICRDHDLSIYSANFHESGQGPNEKRDSLIWEGHGLMTWIMDTSRDELYIYGKSTEHSIDIYLELQPTLKWSKEEYFSALRNQSFEQFRSSTQSPLHPICNCYHVEDMSSSSQNRHLYSHKSSNETEFDRYLRHQQQSSPPLPSRLPSTHNSTTPTTNTTNNNNVPVFRPEPIFPSTTASSNNNNSSKITNTNTTNSSTTTPTSATAITNNVDYMKRSRQTSPFYNNNNNNNNNNKEENDLTLPMPQSYKKDNRRSAFTIASLSDKYIPPSTNSSNTSCSSQSPPPTCNDIPVVYTPSNKKRKKTPMLMPATTSTNEYSRGMAQQQQQPPPPPPPPPSQQVNTVVRTYYEVDRDNQGAYILPVEIDSWTVVDLGTVIYERPAYHNQRYIYPVNYTVRKWYRSMVDPKSDTQYTCRILENGREPKFEVTADDCPMTYSGPTPTTVWTIIVRRAFAIRNQEYGHNPVGPDFFGLRKNTIAKMIQDLPNASKCSQYVWQTFEPARFNKPGRNRRRADSTLPGSLLGGVNYGLTSSRLLHNTNLTSTQHSYRSPPTTKQSPTLDKNA
ncbi:unnamed protein product [Mucor hiemalis]